jgi:oligopeptide/dipeptide ABC transporter ATP-binding protein
MNDSVLQVRNVKKYYPVRKKSPLEGKQYIHAVDDVSFSIKRGETIALVGESGCGKSTLAKCIIQLTKPTDGEILLYGADLTTMSKSKLRLSRQKMQIVFQNPYDSLNPRKTVSQTIVDPLRIHNVCAPPNRKQEANKILKQVGLDSDFLHRYPHELSGGQQQRVAIARALAVRPELIICDESVSALDVSVQAQIVNLLLRLQKQFGISYLFISHDLHLSTKISDRIAVMYLGQIVEFVDSKNVRSGLMHPYSKALFASAPSTNPYDRSKHQASNITNTEPPSPIEPLERCRFQSRCPFRQQLCNAEAPTLRSVEGRLVRCHYAEDLRNSEQHDPEPSTNS